MSKFSSYNEELGINCVDDTEVYAVREKMKDYIPSLEDDYLDKFVIVKSKLLYVGTDEKELEVANRLGIRGSLSDEETVKEVQTIVDGVVGLKKDFKEQIPVNDTDKLDSVENSDSENGLVGTRLFSRSDLNLVNGTWNILIEYNKENKETARYGTGYYWLKKSDEEKEYVYTIKGKEIKLKNDYVIDYKNGEFQMLSGRAVNWNVDATLGVTDDLPLNLDPVSLANGEWRVTTSQDSVTKTNYFDFIVRNSDETEINTGIQKAGDVEYDKENKSLKFNETSETNPDGEGGHLKLVKNGLDFSHGLTFEFYGKFSRGPYENKLCSQHMAGVQSVGIFMRASGLPNKAKHLRFTWCSTKWICDFCDDSNNKSAWSGQGKLLRTEGARI